MAVAALLLSATLLCRYWKGRLQVRERAVRIIGDREGDKAKVLALLEFCAKINTLSVKIYPLHDINTLPFRRRSFALFHRLLPINLIPPATVLNHHLSYTGPCGAKSKLLVAVLKAVGYTARLQGLNGEDWNPYHSVVEVQLNGKWVPLDPTYNLYFTDRDGSLVSTDHLAADHQLFMENVENWEKATGGTYNRNYTYTNASAMSVFYVIHRLLQAAGLVSNEDAPVLYGKLTAILPPQLVEHDLGVPFFYTDPALLFIFTALTVTAAVLLLLCCGRKAETDERRACATQSRPAGESTADGES